MNYYITTVTNNMYKYWIEYREENRIPNEISLIYTIKDGSHFRYLTIRYTGKHVKLSEYLLMYTLQCKLTKLTVPDCFHHI